MFIDRLEVHNNSMIKNTAYITHTHTPHAYSHSKTYQYQSKKTVIIPTHTCIYRYYNK